ncbi:MAG: pyridoxal 5'-phosphate synthase [Zhongshania sp.]|uniref:pyridoxine/pyridoxamine 5'-phosphate oxidase n=1 Tax=Zhongshania sp. TaxID=1971902 RepID=UPI00261BE2CB|nr:pyridoxal 5'-phosphate synthase [Zhongshania sp.]MDF1693528.1 pyridoxal 5'-phosphate synthase [Zhongshania sp.]
MSRDYYQVALDRLTALIDEARSRGSFEAEVAALATADVSARPSVRMISIQAVDAAGLLFFANVRSGKGLQILANPQASLCFYWPALQEQAIIEGSVEVQSLAVSDQYWNRRMRAFQIAAWASEQGTPAEETKTDGNLIDQQAGNFSSGKILRQENWLAFRIVPYRIEFWPSGWHRRRERIKYQRDKEGAWSKEMLNP